MSEQQRLFTHWHRVTGDPVTVTGHVNGITIFDSVDEPGEELLDDVFAEQYTDGTVESNPVEDVLR
jgi:hypothetical protein